MNKLVLVIIAVAFLFCTQTAEAQLFGSRSIRRSMTRQGNNNVGRVQGNERFVRGRRRDSFVGADQREMQGFVGSEQARVSGRIASPTGGLREFVDKSSQINRPVPTLKKADFYPSSLLLPNELIKATLQTKNATKFSRKLNLELRSKVNESIEVFVADRTANLRGEVATAREKILAELLIRFEPGIDEIRNEIQVVGQ